MNMNELECKVVKSFSALNSHIIISKNGLMSRFSIEGNMKSTFELEGDMKPTPRFHIGNTHTLNFTRVHHKPHHVITCRINSDVGRKH